MPSNEWLRIICFEYGTGFASAREREESEAVGKNVGPSKKEKPAETGAVSTE